MLEFNFRVVLYLLLPGILGVSLAKYQFYVNFLAWGFPPMKVVVIWTCARRITEVVIFLRGLSFRIWSQSRDEFP